MIKKIILASLLVLVLVFILEYKFETKLFNLGNKSEMSTRIDCSDVQSYKDQLTSKKLSLSADLPFSSNFSGYILESKHKVKIGKTIFLVSCYEGSLNEKKASLNDKVAVLIHDDFKKSFLDITLLDTYANFDHLEDVNGDGNEEIFIKMASFVMCYTCERTEIIEIKDDKATWLTKDINIPEFSNSKIQRDYGQSVYAIEDLDGDGIKELLVNTSIWEMSFGFCHACGPSSYKIYKWAGDKYLEDKTSKGYFAEHEKNLKYVLEYWKSKANPVLNKVSSEDSLSTAIQILIDYEALGRKEEGWNFFWSNTNPSLYKTQGDSVNTASKVITAREVLKKQYDNKLPFAPK